MVFTLKLRFFDQTMTALADERNKQGQSIVTMIEVNTPIKVPLLNSNDLHLSVGFY